MYCGHCGASNADDLKFCTGCGSDLGAQRTPAPQGSLRGHGTALPGAPAADLAPGASVGPSGRYRIRRRLGAGGMGLVYQATDRLGGREVEVALKVLSPELLADESARSRFLDEAESLQRLRHPNIVALRGVDFDAQRDLYLLVMELLQGRTLREELAEHAGPLPLERIVDVLGQACAGLAHAHEHDLVHRDVKPENLFLCADGRVKLLDFGLVRLAGGQAGTYTRLGAGTPLYMAPEQLKGEPPDARTDLYSLGVVLWECLTGELPPAAEPASQLRQGLDGRWDDLVGHATKRRRDQRLSSVEEFEQLLRGASTSSPPRARVASPVVAEPAAGPVVAESAPRAQVAGSEGGSLDIPGLSFLEVNSSGCEVYLREKDAARMILVPGGTFRMGTERGGDESPAHDVTLNAYLLQETPVTWAQYRCFCESIGREVPRTPLWGRWLDDHPVVNVSWVDAHEYCGWAGGRLPTEAEWERAARGDDGRTYPWGEDKPSPRLAACGRQVKQGPDPVGRHSAGRGPFGHLDLCGSVWEWCADWYDSDYYLVSPQVDPVGPATRQERVLRGGSYGSHHPLQLRGANRHRRNPSHRGDGCGFRCAHGIP